MKNSFKLSSNKYAILILILFLSFVFSAVPKVQAESTTFKDDFEGTTVDQEKWVIQENTNMSGYPASGGSVRVMGGQISLSSVGSSFPCVTSALNPFPATGDFSVEFNFTYTCISDWGNGLWISNGPFIVKEEEESSNVIFQLWADNDGFDKVSIRARLFGELIYFSEIYGWEPSAPTHTFRLEYSNAIYAVFVDTVEAGSTSSQVRPDSIGFGHPPTYYIPFSPEHVNSIIGGWGSFAIDYIRVSDTAQVLDNNVSDKNSAQISFFTDAEDLKIGFVVGVNGILTNQEGEPLRDETVILSYSVSGTSIWDPIASATTDFDGVYSASWIPTGTGRFALKVEWVGNETYLGTYDVKNISVSRYESKSLFLAESNSSLSSLAFNSTSRDVSFTVSGPSGTMGYVRFLISKTIVEDLDFEVYVDGQQIEFNATSVGSFQSLYFKYPHSSHYVTIKLPATSKTEQILAIVAAAVLLTVVSAVFIVYFKKRNH
jgi:hypothetical protein